VAADDEDEVTNCEINFSFARLFSAMHVTEMKLHESKMISRFIIISMSCAMPENFFFYLASSNNS
jgi:hypothetical protein